MNRSMIFIVLLLLTACNRKPASISGGYILILSKQGDSIWTKEIINKKIIKIISNGHWVTATSSGYPETTFEGGAGGTYSIEGNKYIESTHYTSDRSLDNIETTTFEYTLNDGKLILQHMSNKGLITEEYEKISSDKKLADTFLQGVWKIKTHEWFGNTNTEKDFAQIKIYSYPLFIWAQYRPEAKEFLGAGGGTYQFDGKKLVERLEYFSFFDVIPADQSITITKTAPGEFFQVNGEGQGKETWKKIE